MKKQIILSIVLCCILCATLRADVKMPAILSDNMVLQSGVPVPVWGWASPEEKITVTFGDQTHSAKADSKGNWSVTLTPLNPNAKGEMTIEGQNKLIIKNILVGEVWICSGQSNMQFGVYSLEKEERDELLKRKAEDRLRFFVVKREGRRDPQNDVEGKWEICDSRSLRNFSAIGYYFAFDLYKKLNVPVGMINASMGGTRAECWIPINDINANKSLNKLQQKYKKVRGQILEGDEYQKVKHSWQKDSNELRKFAHKHPDEKDRNKLKQSFEKQLGRQMAEKPVDHLLIPALFHNGMINGLKDFAVRGVIWYQGESNGWAAGSYKDIFTCMINSWRKQWNDEKLPFLFVQLPGYQKRDNEPQTRAPWAELREAQWLTEQSLPECYMSSAIDLGQEDDIHPKKKKPVAKRLFLNACANVYGEKDIVWSGPRMDKVEFKDGKAIITFNNTAGGLVTSDGKPPSAFAIAGKDKKFVWADATIENNSIILNNEKVSDPVAVRYGWSMFPVVNLYNKDGLPALPFKTDQ